MQLRNTIIAVPLLATLNTVAAVAQESLSFGATVTAAIDEARIDRLFQPNATSSAGEAAMPFPGTSTDKDEFASAIPVFVPGGLFDELSRNATPFAGTSRGFEGEAADATILFDDAGYFATLDFDRFRMTVEGTNVVHGTSEGLEATASMPAADYYIPFVADYAGAAVQFGFAGVDYLVHFECKVGPEEEEVGGTPCITEVEVERLISSFLICSSEGQCLRRDPKNLTQRTEP